MLVLTRKVGEVLIINDNVKLEVLSVRGTQVRFGIVAPKDIKIWREEVYEKIQAEKNGNS